MVIDCEWKGESSMLARRCASCLIIVLVVLLTFPVNLQAEEDFASDEYLSSEVNSEPSEVDTAPTSAAEFEGSGSAGIDLFWIILKICGVMFLLSGGIYVLVHFLKKSGLGGSDNEFMKVISSLPVGRDKYLRVVQVGKQFLVIGVTDGSINRVCEIEDGETIQALKMAGEESQVTGNGDSASFKNVFRQFLGNSAPGDDSNSASGNPFDEIQERLEEISVPGESST